MIVIWIILLILGMWISYNWGYSDGGTEEYHRGYSHGYSHGYGYCDCPDCNEFWDDEEVI